jgi:hypothetical protein
MLTDEPGTLAFFHGTLSSDDKKSVGRRGSYRKAFRLSLSLDHANRTPGKRRLDAFPDHANFARLPRLCLLDNANPPGSTMMARQLILLSAIIAFIALRSAKARKIHGA